MFRTDSLKNDARLVVLMMMVLPLTLDTNDIVSGSERSADSEIVCWCWRTKGSRTVDSKASKESSAEDVHMVSANPSGIESRVAMAVFVLLCV